MPPSRPRLRPGVESLDPRVVLSTLSAFRPVPGSQPSADRGRAFTPADLVAYAVAYETRKGEPGFAPQYDFNGSGFIGQNDATPILRGLAGITPPGPLKVSIELAPGQQVLGHHPANSGGVTRLGTVTVIGKTAPNSIVFLDQPGASTTSGGTGNFKFQGGALATDSRGVFQYTIKLAAESDGGSLTTTTYLIRTPSHQQLIRAFPILRIR